VEHGFGQKHANFAGKYNLPFIILADADKKIIRAYGATGLSRRISYLIDPTGNITKVYGRVRPAQHAAEVLADLALVKVQPGGLIPP